MAIMYKLYIFHSRVEETTELLIHGPTGDTYYDVLNKCPSPSNGLFKCKMNQSTIKYLYSLIKQIKPVPMHRADAKTTKYFFFY